MASIGDQLDARVTREDSCFGCGISLMKWRRYPLSSSENLDLRDFINQNRPNRFEKRKIPSDSHSKVLSESDSICD